jgi:hypothetical protein
MKKAALFGAGTVILLLAFAWLALPGIVQSQAEKFIAEKTGHRLSLARPEINPLTLGIRLRDLRLDEPDGTPLVAFKELWVDLSSASLTGPALVFDAIVLDGLALNLTQQKEGLNWTPLLTALQGKEAPPEAKQPLPRIDIRQLAVRAAVIDLADRRTTPTFATRLEPLEIELAEVSTLPDDRGRFSIAAKTPFGAELEWRGEIGLNPLASTGHLNLRAVDLSRLAPLLQGKLPLLPPSGIAAVDTDYRFALAAGKLELALEKIGLQLQNLVIRQQTGDTAPRFTVGSIQFKDGRFDLGNQQLAIPLLNVEEVQLDAASGNTPRTAQVALKQLQLADAAVDLAGRTARLSAVMLEGGRIALRRDADGKIDLAAAITALTPPPAAEPSAPWRYQIERIGLSNISVDARDESMSPPIELGFDAIGATLNGLSDNLKTPLPLTARLDVRSGGHLELKGKLTPADAAIDAQIKLIDLALKPAQAFVTRAAALELAGGKLSAEGQVLHDARRSSYRGSFALRDLNLTQEGEKRTFLGWKSLATAQMTVTPTQLDIGELRLDGLDGALIIYSDKSTNLKRILRTPDAPVEPVAAAPAAAGGKSAYIVNLDRLRFRAGKLDFGDYSLLIPFETRIHGLRGSLSGLSTTPGTPGQLELDGEVDNFGLARAAGQIELFNPTNYTDLKVIFRNLEMTRLTPYMATFAGRKIESGKLSLDLEYKINQRQLKGENQIVIESLELGERVASPTAKDLPLDLAIAILRDSDGRIDLGLPISGNLDDPQFSYGQIVWKAITNVLSKIVTAPFRALGSLFGGSAGEKIDSIAFDAGASRLTPPEREKLVRIAGVLNKRPGLALTVQGTWAEPDRVALQDRQLRRAVAVKVGESVTEKGDPGPLSTRAPKVQAALETLFADRFGSTELAALKDGFRQANPGQLEQNAAGKMMSRLSGLMREKRTLELSEVDQLKGSDFYVVLFEKLRAQEKIGDETLQALAIQRGEQALAALTAAGAPEGHYRTAAAEKIEAEGREIVLKLSLGKLDK